MQNGKTKVITLKRTIMLAAVGAAAGVVNGIFGTGGGTVMVLTLPLVCRDIDTSRLFANVCAAVLPISLASAFTYSSFSPPDSTAIWVGVAALGGGAVGAFLLGKLKPTALKLIFSAVMAVSGIVMLVR